MSTVLPAYQYRHVSGRTASITGAAPWHTAAERSEWRVETIGYTVQHPDGTVGIGRRPFQTKEEAQAWCNAHPNFRGMS